MSTTFYLKYCYQTAFVKIHLNSFSQ